MSGSPDMLADRAGRDEPTDAAMRTKPKTKVATNRSIFLTSRFCVRVSGVPNESVFFLIGVFARKEQEEDVMEAQAIAYTANHASIVFKILIECLEKNGALLPGQVQKALRATIGHPKAEQHRLDFVLLAKLLHELDATARRADQR
jgi:hypothetical protein